MCDAEFWREDLTRRMTVGEFERRERKHVHLPLFCGKGERGKRGQERGSWRGPPSLMRPPTDKTSRQDLGTQSGEVDAMGEMHEEVHARRVVVGSEADEAGRAIEIK